METDQTTILQNVGRAFGLPGSLCACEKILRGHINTTYRVDYTVDAKDGPARESYIFQKVNTYVFKKPAELMDNIIKVTEYIDAHSDGTTLRFRYSDVTGKRLPYFEGEGGFWRVCNFVRSATYDNTDDPAVIRSAGEAFGEFQNVLRDFDPSLLHETIPGFHDTRRRYEALKEAIAADPLGRAAEAREEIAYLLSVEDDACRLVDLCRAGELPLRVTHNDTKINNVLFDEHEPKALVVIDLDTVMPGVVGNDFGDAIRTAANVTEEDCPDTARTALDLAAFRAFAEGFLSRTAGALTQTEIDTLGISCFALTIEVAVRFLTDFLSGDPYFRIKSEKHNLQRTRCQIALARDMYRKTGEMDAVVLAAVRAYGRT